MNKRRLIIISILSLLGGVPVLYNSCSEELIAHRELKTSIDLDRDGTPAETDCNDQDPSAAELKLYYVDSDQDLAGSLTIAELCASIPPSGYSLNSSDCDDANSNIVSLVEYFIDQDKDGYGSTSKATLCSLSAPSGYAINPTDCDDENALINKTVSYFQDNDGDGFGSAISQSFCKESPPTGYALASGDPDDSNKNIVPTDSDGDTVANAIDCAPSDAAKYSLEPYYADIDGDGMGVSPILQICTSVPAPSLAGYSKTSGDSCPNHKNLSVDWDEDGLDDACDKIIHFKKSKTFTKDLKLTNRTIDGQSVKYIFGDTTSNPLKFTFGSDLSDTLTFIIDSNVDVTVVGASELLLYNTTLYMPLITSGPSTLKLTQESKLRLKKSKVGTFAALNLGNGHSTSNGVILGDGSRTEVVFEGAELFARKRAKIDKVGQVHFKTILAKNTATNRDEKLGSTIQYDTSYSYADSDYLEISNSINDSAMTVWYQYLDLSRVRFVNNKGYPLTCLDSDGKRYASYSSFARVYTSSCQSAIAEAYFIGNHFNGPVLSTSAWDETTVDMGYRYEFSKPHADRGTNTVYISGFGVNGTSSGVLRAEFHNLKILPYQTILSRDASGNVTSSKPGYNNLLSQSKSSTKYGQINIYGGEVGAEITVMGGRLNLYDAKVTSFVRLQSKGSANFGYFSANNTEFDFTNSSQLSNSTISEVEKSAFFTEAYDFVGPHYLTLTNSQIKMPSNGTTAILGVAPYDISSSVSLSNTTVQFTGDATLYNNKTQPQVFKQSN